MAGIMDSLQYSSDFVLNVKPYTTLQIVMAVFILYIILRLTVIFSDAKNQAYMLSST